MKRVVGALTALILTACALPIPPPPPPPSSLEGDWRVVAVNGRPAAGSARIAPPMFTIGFGCNSGHGTYQIQGSVLMPIGPMAVTERACAAADDKPSDIMQQESEGFRIATRHMQVTLYGPSRVRLSNEAGTIDLSR